MGVLKIGNAASRPITALKRLRKLQFHHQRAIPRRRRILFDSGREYGVNSLAIGRSAEVCKFRSSSGGLHGNASHRCRSNRRNRVGRAVHDLRIRDSVAAALQPSEHGRRQLGGSGSGEQQRASDRVPLRNHLGSPAGIQLYSLGSRRSRRQTARQLQARPVREGWSALRSPGAIFPLVAERWPRPHASPLGSQEANSLRTPLCVAAAGETRMSFRPFAFSP